MKALEDAPAKLLRVWDRDFSLVYAFRADEDYADGLPLDHPVARFLLRLECDEGAYLSTDENGSRVVERLEWYEVRKADRGIRVIAFWTE